MARTKVIRLGTIGFDHADITKDRGHEYGRGRVTEVQRDKRNRRKTTRKDRVKEAMKGW